MTRSRLSHMVIGCLSFLLLVLLPACGGTNAAQGSSPQGSAPKEVVIGATIPETGPLAGFGVYEKWAYNAAVDDLNKAGGLYLSQYKTKVPVRLIIYDDQSLPQQNTTNTQRLVLQDKVTALLGSWTPPQFLAEAAVAEREHIPLVGSAPIRAFLGARSTWSDTWDVFFDELSMTKQQFLTMNTVSSNKKIALFTDNEQDGVVMGGLWEQNAKQYGYTIAYHASFPVGTTDYSDLIRKAQASGAQIVVSQMITPDAIALWKQMDSLNYRPQAAFFEKSAEPVAWSTALGKLAEGVMVSGYWHPALAYPGAATLRQRFEQDTKQTYSEAIAPAYADAQILLDAMSSASKLDTNSINAALAKINKTYVVGPVNFATGPGGRASALPSFMLQWQNGQQQLVYPSNLQTAKIVYPLPAWNTLGS